MVKEDKLLRKRNDLYGRGHFRLVGIEEILEAMDDHQLHLMTRVGSWTTLLRFRVVKLPEKISG